MPDGYATEVIVPHTEQYAWKYSRHDVVFGLYHKDNLKSEAWQKRGTDSNIRPLKSWNNFLRCDDSKG